MGNSKRDAIEKKIMTLLRRFDIEDIKEYVLPELNLTWKVLKKAVIHYNFAFTSADVSKLLLHMLKDKQYNNLSDIYHNILLIDLIQHNIRRNWTTVVLKRARETVPTETTWARNIISCFRKKVMDAQVHSSRNDDLVWFVIIVKTRTRNKAILCKSPVFVAVSVNEPYMFYAPTTMQPKVLQVVVDALGYDDYRTCNLTGKSIPSLLLMLDRKRNASKIRQTLPPPDAHVDVVRSTDGYNFVQEKENVKYISNLNGNVQLESFNINIETKWLGLQTLPEFENTEFNTKLTIQSANVAETIKDLVRQKAISQPFPAWVQEFSLRGRNTITIGKKQ